MGALDPSSGVVYESVIFLERTAEVSFTEDADRGVGVARVQTMVIEFKRLPEEFADFIEALSAWVDAGLVALRNPPDSVPSRG